MRTAVVHEWLTARSGSELCFERIAGLWSEADLFALAWDRDVKMNVEGRDIKTTVLDRAARTEPGRAVILPLMPAAFRAMRPKVGYELVVTSSHAFSRAFPGSGAAHLSYTYTPLRYVWYPDIDARGASPLLGPARAALRRVDKHYAKGVTAFAGISTVVAQRIEETYEREAEIIFPFCDTEFFSLGGGEDRSLLDEFRLPDDYILSFGRLIPYKRHDLAIRVAAEIGVRAVVAGRGPDLQRLKAVDEALEGGTVFIDAPDRAVVRALYRNALFTLFPPMEDFGIVPVESLACGTPVLALDGGGSLDTVPTGVGVRSPSQDVPDMVESADKLLANLPEKDDCRRWAETFSPEMFDARFMAWADEVLC